MSRATLSSNKTKRPSTLHCSDICLYLIDVDVVVVEGVISIRLKQVELQVDLWHDSLITNSGGKIRLRVTALKLPLHFALW